MYNIYMKKKPLSETNPYLRDRDQRQTALIRSVVSSSAIEGILYTFKEGESAAFEEEMPKTVRKRSKTVESRR
jgi:hypothetical protein